MRATTTLTLTLCALLSSACGSGGSGSGSDVWTRVEQVPGGWLIARADPLANTCHVLTLSSLTSAQAIPGIDSNVDGVVAVALFEGDDPRRCTTNTDGLRAIADPRGSGRIELGRTDTSNGLLSACEIDLELVVEGVEFRARGLYVWDSACEPAPSETVQYASLSAAYSAEDERLIVAGWDPVDEACAWFRFGIAVGVPTPPGLAVPAQWLFANAAIADIDEAQCSAEQLLAGLPPDAFAVSGNPAFGGGALSFTDARTQLVDGVEVEVPCTIDIDAWVPFGEPYAWAPPRAGLSGQLAVAGACP